MKKSLRLFAGAASSFVLMSSLAQAGAIENRLENLETGLEIAEEANAELRTELENRMRISGYVDVEYVVKDKNDPGFRMHHLSLFFQKKLSDKWRFFSEIEYEDGPKVDNEEGNTVEVNTPTGTTNVADFSAAEGKIFVEAINMDYLWKPQAIIRVGRFFTPAGIWSVDHYPPFVSMQERPKHIRKIFPQLVDGAMVYGTFGLGKNYLNYNAYVGNGEGNIGHGDSDNQRAMGLKTSFVASVPMFSHLELGGTFYNDPNLAGSGSNKTAMGGHLKAVVGDVTFQSEAAYSKFEEPTSTTKKGYYGQLTYAPNQWAVGARHDLYNSGSDRVANSVFVNYQALTNLVLKVEHHMIDDDGTDSTKTILSIVSYLE